MPDRHRRAALSRLGDARRRAARARPAARTCRSSASSPRCAAGRAIATWSTRCRSCAHARRAPRDRRRRPAARGARSAGRRAAGSRARVTFAGQQRRRRAVARRARRVRAAVVRERRRAAGAAAGDVRRHPVRHDRRRRDRRDRARRRHRARGRRARIRARARRRHRRAARRSPRRAARLAANARASSLPRYGLDDDARPDGGVFRRALAESAHDDRSRAQIARNGAASYATQRHRVSAAAIEPFRRPRDVGGARARRATPRATPPPRDPRRILVAHHLLLGDTLMLTPLLAKLRARYPDADIAMTVPRAACRSTRRGPTACARCRSDPRAFRARAVRAKPAFDLAFVPGDNRYAGSPRRCARAGSSHSPATAPAAQELAGRRARRLSAIGPLRGATWSRSLVDGRRRAPYSHARLARAAGSRLRAAAAAATRCCTSARARRSSTGRRERWAALAGWLAARGIAPVWSAGAARSRDRRRAAIRAARYASFAGTLDLAQLWHLLRRRALLVAPDTGIAHLGAHRRHADGRAVRPGLGDCCAAPATSGATRRSAP